MLTITCPLCKTDNRSDYIINNHFLIEKLNQAQNDDGASGSGSSSGSAEELPKCANDDNPASSFCVECCDLICDSCVDVHQQLKITKNHTIKSKDAAEIKSDKDTKKEIRCPTHPQVRDSLFIDVKPRDYNFSPSIGNFERLLRDVRPSHVPRLPAHGTS